MAGNGSQAILLTKPARWTPTAKDPGTPGTLTLYSSKVTWRPTPPATAAPISVVYSVITNKQKAKGKPFARIATAAGAFMFLFATEQDRDEAVDCMSQPEKAQQASKQALDFIPPTDIRKLIFNDDESLKEVYQKLVAEGVLGEAEFWATRRDLVSHYRRTAAQQAGSATAMLTEALTADSQGGGKLSFRMTPEIIRAIFVEKPAVHRTYLANVPHNLDDTQFWTRYLKHTYAMKVARPPPAHALGT